MMSNFKYNGFINFKLYRFPLLRNKEMKKFGAMIVLMAASMSAYAESQIIDGVEKNSFIKADVATGMWRTSRFTYDKDLNPLVCKPMYNYVSGDFGSQQSCTDSKGESKWIKMENAVPPGKVFAGLKSLNVGNIHYIEIYWKQAKQ